uniref:Hyaluronidase n=1 Tax=Fundulus heteroclitus TaxID=8078 RepID=A0A3Q2PY07_FUNHE
GCAMSEQFILNFLSLCVPVLALTLGPSSALPRTDTPVPPGHHFMFMWNAPTELCESRFGIRLDLSYFSLVSSTLKSATNQSISIFYTDRFGLFPYVDEDTGEMYDDGLPQLVDLKEHRELAEDDIEYYIPLNQSGLAVLDFEEWRPQWIRNWGKERAKVLFQRAAKKYFLRSIRLGKRLRPNRLWGYYLYPDCYNYDYNHDMAGFTGECPPIEKSRNDELLWLWTESTALFPSIYLELVLRDTQQARMFVRHRIQEAMRVSFDLVNTIGEAAALGAAGVVSWGDMNVTDTEDWCVDALNHLDRVMNPYILNVSTATRLCSEALCQSQGRCVRKNWDDDVYLHLDARRFTIERRTQRGPLTVRGGLSQDDINYFNRSFNCMCYSKAPCHSVLTLNVISGAVVNPRSGTLCFILSISYPSTTVPFTLV